MAMNDPIGDMLTRIRNAQMRRRPKVAVPASLLRGRTMPGLHRPGESLQPRGASYLRLSVWAFNEAALRFYEQLGHGVHSRILGKELPSAV